MAGADIYIDESCQCNHRYLVLGGIIAETHDLPAILNRISETKRTYNLTRELKWTKVSRAYLAHYQAVVNTFFELFVEHSIHFHCLIVDTRRVDHALYNQGSAEIGFSKFIYQLLVNKFGRMHREYAPFNVYLDSRTTKQSLDELRDILNNGIAKRHDIHSRPYRRLQFRDSKESDLIQITDILIGAIGCRKNEHHLRQGASAAKIMLSDYIAKKAGLASLCDTTPYGSVFSIWNLRLR